MSEEKQEEKQPSKEKIRYVEVSGASGWQTISRTVRELDEEKVRDAKEDIDNLLVFAGLFSAVLTAFLIESYTALQPDPQMQMILLLQQIATQTNAMSSGFPSVNSTAPTPFNAPTWALRVNGLWFASLIVALAAASVGILVKSWLREYLSGEWISPQQKLRARQYRNPALADWKVFEIAALLPLLLQLALGLFFIGLCFFTAAVDERMALTSVPLISAWAFFLAMTAIAPLLTPRCPFKVPFLKRALKSGRRHLMPRATNLVRHLLTKVEIEWTPSNKLEEDEIVLKGPEDTELLLSIDAIMADDSLLPTLWSTFWQSTQAEQTQESMRFIVTLIRHRVSSGLDGPVYPAEGFTYFIDLSALSRHAYIAIMNMLGDVLEKYASPPYQNISPGWAHSAVLLLLSRYPHPLPSDALHALHTFLDDSKVSWWIGDTLGIRTAPALQGGHPFQPMANQLLHFYTSSDVPSTLAFTSPIRLYNRLVKAMGKVDDDTGTSILVSLRKYPNLLGDENMHPVLEDLWNFASGISRWWCDRSTSVAGTSECLLLVAEFGVRLGKTQELKQIVSTFWAKDPKRFLILEKFCSAAPHLRIRNMAEMSEISQNAFFSADSKTQLLMLKNSISVATYFCTGGYVADKGYDPLDMVLFASMHIRIYQHLLTKLDKFDDSAEHATSQWTELWTETSKGVRNYWETKGWTATFIKRQQWEDPELDREACLQQDREVAEECLAILEQLEARGSIVGKVAPRATRGGTPTVFVVPDELVVALGLFILPTNISRFPWLARLNPGPKLKSP